MKRIDLCVPSILEGQPVTCGFTTRRGGVSMPPFDTLNFGSGSADDPAHVVANYRLLRDYVGMQEHRTALMRQVHGITVKAVTDGGLYLDTDGLVTDSPGLLLGVRVADCVPLLLFDPVRQVVGAIHCGWKPIAGGIVERALSIMAGQYGSAASDILAAAGPSAGPCCYEVGAATAGHFRDSSVDERDGSIYVDLKAELASRLLDFGLPDRNIELHPDCTICNPRDYYSYRRDGEASGRMMGFILLHGS